MHHHHQHHRPRTYTSSPHHLPHWEPDTGCLVRQKGAGIQDKAKAGHDNCIRGNDSRAYEGNVKWIMREDRALLAFFFFFSHSLHRRGWARQRYHFVWCFFPFPFSISCICTIRGRHRPLQRKLRKTDVVFFSHCILHRGVVLVLR